MRKQPRAYRGKNHETLGSDILAILATVTLPELVLGSEWVQKLSLVHADGWYPISLLLELMDHLHSRCGAASLVKMGKQLFRDSHQKEFLKTATSAGDAIFRFNDFYHHANRGIRIGGWEVLEFSEGHALLEKTTPHLCILEEGIWAGAFAALGFNVLIVQPQCVQTGGNCCRFEMRSSVRDARWMGKYKPVTPLLRVS